MGTVILDANVLIAFADSVDAHHPVVVQVLRDLHGSGSRLATPASAYSESLVHPFIRSPEAASLFDSIFDDLPVQVVPISRAIGREAARLRARHGRRLKLPDALVVATAAVEQGSVLTTDAEWPSTEVDVRVLAGL